MCTRICKAISHPIKFEAGVRAWQQQQQQQQTLWKMVKATIEENLIDRLHKNGLFFHVVGDIYGTKRYIEK